MSKSDFNLHWDDLLEFQLQNATEIDANAFKEEFSFDPAIFDESMEEGTDSNNVVTLLTNSQISEYAHNVTNEMFTAAPINTDSLVAESPMPPNDIDDKDSDTVKNFIDVNLDEVKNFNTKEKNKNTTRVTDGNMRRLKQYLKLKNEQRQIYDIPMCELDEILSMFILAVRKEDGEDYQPSSLRQYLSTFDRVLAENYYPYTIGKGSRQGFPLLRETMASKFKRLKKDGKGNKENAAQPVSDEEIDVMYAKGVLGRHTPEALINTIWMNFTIQFGMRGVQEHYMLCWGDVKKHSDADGTEYLELVERQTKTRTGEHLDTRRVPPRIWATDDERDPVATYNYFAARRPPGFSGENDPFYIAPKTTPVKSEDASAQWFMRQRIGQKKLATLMKVMSAKAGIERRLTNHSARKHLVQKLRDSGAKPTDIMQISGHKNVQSILNYSDMSIQNQRKCSEILSSNVKKNVLLTSTVQSENVPSVSLAPAQPSNQPAQAAVHYPTQATMPGPMGSMFYGATVHIHAFHMYGAPPSLNN